MEQFPTHKVNSKEEKLTTIKEHVDFVFNENPELSSIGTKEEYSQYLETIFPESKYKEILFHGTRENIKFDKFELEKISNARNFGRGVYFSPSLDKPMLYKGDSGHIISSVINTGNPFITMNHYNGFYKVNDYIKDNEIKISDYAPGYDSVFNFNYLDRDSLKKFNDNIIEYTGERDENGMPTYQKEIYKSPELKEVVIENPENIHILGSHTDLERFKGYISELTNDAKTK
jgi:hypothetical protein